MSVIAHAVSPALGINMVWILLGVALFSLWAYYRIKYRRQIAYGNKIPGPPYSLPLVGDALQALWIGSHKDVFNAFVEGVQPYKHHGIAKLWLGPRLMVGIWNPEDIECILSSNVHLTKPAEYDFFKPWFGNGLLISSGDTWRTHRKLISPTFHLSVLRNFVSLFNENSRQTCERMRKDIGKEFDAHDYMVETTVEILLETVMGVNKNNQESAYGYGIAVMKMCDIIHSRHLRFWLRSDWIFNLTKQSKIQEKMLNTIHSLTKKVIREKRERNKREGAKVVTDDSSDSKNPKAKDNSALSNIKDDLDDDFGEKKRKPFLDQLVDISQEGVVLTDTEIKEQVDTIMFEGHDTTAAAASFFMCFMGLHEEYQDKCVEELREIFGDSDRPATFQDTLEMKYLERCILETLRMAPPVPVIGRVIQEDCKLPSGYTLPKGTTVGIATIGLHHWEKIWPDDMTYDPDNFLPDRIASRHPYAFVPFSAGPRSCVGRKYAMLKLKILLSTILRTYKIKSYNPMTPDCIQADIILKRADGFKCFIEPRKWDQTPTEAQTVNAS